MSRPASQTASAALAFMLANGRYWSTVASSVRSQLHRWESRATAIPDRRLRALALAKLHEERFNVELAATLATLAPRSRRGVVTEAVVAAQVVYDYLDIVGERALLDDPACPHDGGYTAELEATVRWALARLPAAQAVQPVYERAVRRYAQAQSFAHRAARAGRGTEWALKAWSLGEAHRPLGEAPRPTGEAHRPTGEAHRPLGEAPRPTGEAPRSLGEPPTGESPDMDLGWPELLAGAQASVLCVHVLLAAAADRTTTRELAEELDELYLRIGALTMLDSLIDTEQDLELGVEGYIQRYPTASHMGQSLAAVARNAAARARSMPNGGHHLMTMAGIVAYYGSAPAAQKRGARFAFAPVFNELRPALMIPTLALMRIWRSAKWATLWFRPIRRCIDARARASVITG